MMPKAEAAILAASWGTESRDRSDEGILERGVTHLFHGSLFHGSLLRDGTAGHPV